MDRDIDPALLAQYEQATALVKRLYDNVKARPKFLEAVKTLNPDAYIPQIDDVNPILEQIKAVDAKVTAFAEERVKEKRTAELEAARTSLRRQGYQDEGIKKIEELMIAENIPSHEAAELLFKKRNPEPEPLPPAYNSSALFDPVNDKEDEALLADEDAWAEREVHKVLNEMRQPR